MSDRYRIDVNVNFADTQKSLNKLMRDATSKLNDLQGMRGARNPFALDFNWKSEGNVFGNSLNAAMQDTGRWVQGVLGKTQDFNTKLGEAFNLISQGLQSNNPETYQQNFDRAIRMMQDEHKQLIGMKKEFDQRAKKAMGEITRATAVTGQMTGFQDLLKMDAQLVNKTMAEYQRLLTANNKTEGKAKFSKLEQALTSGVFDPKLIRDLGVGREKLLRDAVRSSSVDSLGTVGGAIKDAIRPIQDNFNHMNRIMGDLNLANKQIADMVKHMGNHAALKTGKDLQNLAPQMARALANMGFTQNAIDDIFTGLYKSLGNSESLVHQVMQSQDMLNRMAKRVKQAVQEGTLKGLHGQDLTNYVQGSLQNFNFREDIQGQLVEDAVRGGQTARTVQNHQAFANMLGLNGNDPDVLRRLSDSGLMQTWTQMRGFMSASVANMVAGIGSSILMQWGTQIGELYQMLGQLEKIVKSFKGDASQSEEITNSVVRASLGFKDGLTNVSGFVKQLRELDVEADKVPAVLDRIALSARYSSEDIKKTADAYSKMLMAVGSGREMDLTENLGLFSANGVNVTKASDSFSQMYTAQAGSVLTMKELGILSAYYAQNNIKVATSLNVILQDLEKAKGSIRDIQPAVENSTTSLMDMQETWMLFMSSLRNGEFNKILGSMSFILKGIITTLQTINDWMESLDKTSGGVSTQILAIGTATTLILSMVGMFAALNGAAKEFGVTLAGINALLREAGVTGAAAGASMQTGFMAAMTRNVTSVATGLGMFFMRVIPIVNWVFLGGTIVSMIMNGINAKRDQEQKKMEEEARKAEQETKERLEMSKRYAEAYAELNDLFDGDWSESTIAKFISGKLDNTMQMLGKNVDEMKRKFRDLTDGAAEFNLPMQEVLKTAEKLAAKTEAAKAALKEYQDLKNQSESLSLSGGSLDYEIQLDRTSNDNAFKTAFEKFNKGLSVISQQTAEVQTNTLNTAENTEAIANGKKAGPQKTETVVPKLPIETRQVNTMYDVALQSATIKSAADKLEQTLKNSTIGKKPGQSFIEDLMAALGIKDNLFQFKSAAGLQYYDIPGLENASPGQISKAFESMLSRNTLRTETAKANYAKADPERKGFYYEEIQRLKREREVLGELRKQYLKDLEGLPDIAGIRSSYNSDEFLKYVRNNNVFKNLSQEQLNSLVNQRLKGGKYDMQLGFGKYSSYSERAEKDPAFRETLVKAMREELYRVTSKGDNYQGFDTFTYDARISKLLESGEWNTKTGLEGILASLSSDNPLISGFQQAPGRTSVGEREIKTAAQNVSSQVLQEMAKSITIPENKSACAFVASSILKQMGLSIKTEWGAANLEKQVQNLGYQQVGKASAKVGDLVVFTGKQYGVLKDKNGLGKHTEVVSKIGKDGTIYTAGNPGFGDTFTERKLGATDLKNAQFYNTSSGARLSQTVKVNGAQKKTVQAYVADKMPELDSSTDLNNLYKQNYESKLRVLSKQGESDLKKLQTQLERDQVLALSALRTDTNTKLKTASFDDRKVIQKQAQKREQELITEFTLKKLDGEISILKRKIPEAQRLVKEFYMKVGNTEKEATQKAKLYTRDMENQLFGLNTQRIKAQMERLDQTSKPKQEAMNGWLEKLFNLASDVSRYETKDNRDSSKVQNFLDELYNERRTGTDLSGEDFAHLEKLAKMFREMTENADQFNKKLNDTLQGISLLDSKDRYPLVFDLLSKSIKTAQSNAQGLVPQIEKAVKDGDFNQAALLREVRKGWFKVAKERGDQLRDLNTQLETELRSQFYKNITVIQTLSRELGDLQEMRNTGDNQYLGTVRSLRQELDNLKVQYENNIAVAKRFGDTALLEQEQIINFLRAYQLGLKTVESLTQKQIAAEKTLYQSRHNLIQQQAQLLINTGDRDQAKKQAEDLISFLSKNYDRDQILGMGNVMGDLEALQKNGYASTESQMKLLKDLPGLNSRISQFSGPYSEIQQVTEALKDIKEGQFMAASDKDAVIKLYENLSKRKDLTPEQTLMLQALKKLNLDGADFNITGEVQKILKSLLSTFTNTFRTEFQTTLLGYTNTNPESAALQSQLSKVQNQVRELGSDVGRYQQWASDIASGKSTGNLQEVLGKYQSSFESLYQMQLSELDLEEQVLRNKFKHAEISEDELNLGLEKLNTDRKLLKDTPRNTQLDEIFYQVFQREQKRLSESLEKLNLSGMTHSQKVDAGKGLMQQILSMESFWNGKNFTFQDQNMQAEVQKEMGNLKQTLGKMSVDVLSEVLSSLTTETERSLSKLKDQFENDEITADQYMSQVRSITDSRVNPMASLFDLLPDSSDKEDLLERFKSLQKSSVNQGILGVVEATFKGLEDFMDQADIENLPKAERNQKARELFQQLSQQGGLKDLTSLLSEENLKDLSKSEREALKKRQVEVGKRLASMGEGLIKTLIESVTSQFEDDKDLLSRQFAKGEISGKQYQTRMDNLVGNLKGIFNLLGLLPETRYTEETRSDLEKKIRDLSDEGLYGRFKKELEQINGMLSDLKFSGLSESQKRQQFSEVLGKLSGVDLTFLSGVEFDDPQKQEEKRQAVKSLKDSLSQATEGVVKDFFDVEMSQWDKVYATLQENLSNPEYSSEEYQNKLDTLLEGVSGLTALLDLLPESASKDSLRNTLTEARKNFSENGKWALFQRDLSQTSELLSSLETGNLSALDKKNLYQSLSEINLSGLSMYQFQSPEKKAQQQKAIEDLRKQLGSLGDTLITGFVEGQLEEADNLSKALQTDLMRTDKVLSPEEYQQRASGIVELLTGLFAWLSLLPDSESTRKLTDKLKGNLQGVSASMNLGLLEKQVQLGREGMNDSGNVFTTFRNMNSQMNLLKKLEAAYTAQLSETTDPEKTAELSGKLKELQNEIKDLGKQIETTGKDLNWDQLYSGVSVFDELTRAVLSFRQAYQALSESGLSDTTSLMKELFSVFDSQISEMERLGDLTHTVMDVFAPDQQLQRSTLQLEALKEQWLEIYDLAKSGKRGFSNSFNLTDTDLEGLSKLNRSDIETYFNRRVEQNNQSELRKAAEDLKRVFDNIVSALKSGIKDMLMIPRKLYEENKRLQEQQNQNLSDMASNRLEQRMNQMQLDRYLQMQQTGDPQQVQYATQKVQEYGDALIELRTQHELLALKQKELTENAKTFGEVFMDSITGILDRFADLVTEMAADNLFKSIFGNQGGVEGSNIMNALLKLGGYALTGGNNKPQSTSTTVKVDIPTGSEPASRTGLDSSEFRDVSGENTQVIAENNTANTDRVVDAVSQIQLSGGGSGGGGLIDNLLGNVFGMTGFWKDLAGFGIGLGIQLLTPVIKEAFTTKATSSGAYLDKDVTSGTVNPNRRGISVTINTASERTIRREVDRAVGREFNKVRQF